MGESTEKSFMLIGQALERFAEKIHFSVLPSGLQMGSKVKSLF